jgi:hypothetical protein
MRPEKQSQQAAESKESMGRKAYLTFSEFCDTL